MFKIIIPNFNNEKWLDKCLSSIFNQTFKDFEVIVIDDMSTDGSIDIIKKYPVKLIQADHKVYNGGARNIGIRVKSDKPYTMFLDSDDWLYKEDVLEKIAKHLKKNPVDCLTLQYNCILEDSELIFTSDRNNLHDLVTSENVACWTKVIKTELIQEFPENTLMEDAVQHIKQCNYIKTMDTTKFTSIGYNRMNYNALTNPKKNQSIKWKASIFRLYADLFELWCENEECEVVRLETMKRVKDQIKEGVFVPW
jgi:glycosyltransferase involved in cell wall biosynthesis